MTAQQIRQRYLDYMVARDHQLISRSQLVPQDDPTTLFTGSGMQPLLPYLLGAQHPAGQRLVNSQPCLRAQDIDEVGDNRHTTGFEMLGNWSLGDYFKDEQLGWFFDFLIDEVGLDVDRLYTTCFIGHQPSNIAKDDTSARILQKLYSQRGIEAKVVDLGSAKQGDRHGLQDGRIFFYDDKENWWSRGGPINQTPVGDPAGGDCEFFYDFGHEWHNESRYGQPHPASDSQRFMEIGNAVFMEYRRTATGFEVLDQPKVDFGGGLERIAAAKLNQPDVFRVSLLWPIIEQLQTITNVSYQDNARQMRIITDHFRAACWLAVDGVVPSNKQQGYVMRRLLRRALRVAFGLGVRHDLSRQLIKTIVAIYQDDYPEFARQNEVIAGVINKEEQIFRQTLKGGLRAFKKLTAHGQLDGEVLFKLYDTYGFPTELSLEEATINQLNIKPDIQTSFNDLMVKQKQRSRSIAAGQFKGGLADDQSLTVKHHTATHLMYKALRKVLGSHVIQRGSNVSAQRLRFDFSHDGKLSDQQKQAIEDLVNDQIKKDWPVVCHEQDTKQALAQGVLGAFGDRYDKTVKIYTVGDPEGDHFSREICGGPHVEHTGQLADDGYQFKILKEKSSSAGVRRIKAALVKNQKNN